MLMSRNTLCLRSMSAHPHGESSRVAGLHEHCSRASELAYQTFARADAGDYTTTRNTLHDILTVPGDEVAVIDNVLLLRL